MKLKEKVESLLLSQPIPVQIKSDNEREETVRILKKLGVSEKSEFYELYSKYFIRWVGNSDYGEIVDPLPPQGFVLRTNMAHEYWGISKNFIVFSSGSAESGYLYNTKDNTVWDFSLGQQQELLNGTLPHWNSFYEFMIWYLDTSENED